MKILVIGRGIPTKNAPLRGIFEITQAIALAKLGHDVVYGCVDMGQPSLKHPKEILDNLGVKTGCVNGVNTFQVGIAPKRVMQYIPECFQKSFYTKLFKLSIKKFNSKPDIIYSHYLWITYHLTHLHDKYHVPIIALEHSSDLTKPLIEKKYIELGKKTYSNIQQLICVSTSLSRIIEDNFGIKSIVIPNMVDDNFFSMQNNINFQSKNRPIRLVSVGRLVQDKRYKDLITALSLLNKRNLKFNLTIVGDGPLKQEIEQCINNYGLSSYIKLVGQKANNEVRTILSQNDIFILTSGWETFGVVFIEALAQGLPVIGTKCGGPEDIIDDSNGLLVDIGDVEGIANAIIKLSQNLGNYNPKFLSENVKNKYSSSIIAKRLEQQFYNLIDR